MPQLADKFWIVVAMLTLVSVVAVLHCLAAAMREQEHLDELRSKVGGLRAEQLRRLAERAAIPEIEPEEERKAA
ncbi:MAG TPA: hypothetical protein VD971_10410 [Phycisphaerales bacterium]|nr:hypothetical protein [Phycisphaerales bacterium]